MRQKGFTLIEMLVVLLIMGTIASLSYAALQGAKSSAWDAQRKTDLQDIRSALEIYKIDCGAYPTGDLPWGAALAGPVSISSCANNTYMSKVPQDPLNAREGYKYEYYYNSSSKTYTLCSYLEHPTLTGTDCGSQADKKCKSGSGVSSSCFQFLNNP